MLNFIYIIEGIAVIGLILLIKKVLNRKSKTGEINSLSDPNGLKALKKTIKWKQKK